MINKYYLWSIYHFRFDHLVLISNMEQQIQEVNSDYDDPRIIWRKCQQPDEDPRIVEKLQQLPMIISNFSLNKKSSEIRHHPWLKAERKRYVATPIGERKTKKQVLAEHGYTLSWDPRASAIPL